MGNLLSKPIHVPALETGPRLVARHRGYRVILGLLPKYRSQQFERWPQCAVEAIGNEQRAGMAGRPFYHGPVDAHEIGMG